VTRHHQLTTSAGNTAATANHIVVNLPDDTWPQSGIDK
jgi:hypothetical protein